ncbi:MAG: LPS export ABC transporter periplasmic protein LptC [Alkalilacustris sp.]
MVRSNALHTRLVVGLRVLLPLAAVGLLSTLFLLSQEVDPSQALPYASVDAEDLARDPRITAPRFASVAPDGSAVTLTAETVRIAAGDIEATEAEGVQATLIGPDGSQRWLSAGLASVDGAAGLVRLRGEVDLQDGAGHRLRSERLDVALDRSRVESPGPVSGSGPLGRIDAGTMVIEAQGPDGPTVQRMRFGGGVRLVHYPQPSEGP